MCPVGQIVQLRSELGRVREVLGVEVYEAEERLHFADFTRRGPLAEHSKFLGIGRHTSGGNHVPEIEHLLAEQRALRGLEFETCGADAIEYCAEICDVVRAFLREDDYIV